MDVLVCSLAASEECAVNYHIRCLKIVMDCEDASGDAVSKGQVRLGDLAATIGVSERALRAKFAEAVGMSPTRYLRQRRLAMAYHALLEANPKMTTVTKIALDYGFSELGRFAVAYRELFGESPSATLRRAVGQGQGRPSVMPLQTKSVGIAPDPSVQTVGRC